MKTQIKLGLLMATCAICTAHIAYAQNLDGLFKPSGSSWSCSPNQVGIDGGALSIQDGVFNGVENRCDLTSPVSDGDGTHFTAVCSAEGNTYQEPMVISPTHNGVSIQRNGTTSYWVRCGGADNASATQGTSADGWGVSERTAFIISGGNSFELSCDTFNASSTYPTATLSVPCPTCFPMETNTYALRIDGQFNQNYEFERISNADGSKSELDYYPNWNEGLVPALMAGSVLEVVEYGNVIATFPLTGSSRAIGQLRQKCN